MLNEIDKNDLDKLRGLIAKSVRTSLAVSDEEADSLIEEIIQSLDNWIEAGLNGFHRKYHVADELAGFIVVKDYWKLSHLFVLPEFQGRGIGRSLVEAAVEGCRDRSPLKKIELNSSSDAAGFYEAAGFRQTGPPIDKPGGCIPYEFAL
ncbi:MAG: GNAT family N-acetyltransferase [Planctomycetota bacterium]|jgi:GNAT superfamily N-acetyltransferase